MRLHKHIFQLVTAGVFYYCVIGYIVIRCIIRQQAAENIAAISAQRGKGATGKPYSIASDEKIGKSTT